MAGELFSRFASEADLSPKARRWNGNDKSQRNHHGLIPYNQLPVDIVLQWKTAPSAPLRLIRFYRLYLANLVEAEFISAPRAGKVRLRFYHEFDDCIYIEPLYDRGRRLLIGRY